MITTQFQPFLKMISRLENSKQDSDSAYFYDLLLLGEMLSKTITSAIVAGISDDSDRNRYRLLYNIVRADGIGQWATVLDDALTGVPSQLLPNEIRENEKKELTQRFEKGAWQFESIESLFEVLSIVELPHDDLPKKVALKNWFSAFASLRNGTKAHGATLSSVCSRACIPLEKSLKLIIENFILFKREWAYLYQNMSGKYRVTNLNESILNFEHLKSDKSYMSTYLDGIYVFYDKRTFIELIHSTPESINFYYPNGNFREKQFELLSYITDKRLEGDSSKYLTPTESLPESETEGLGKLEVLNNCFVNIPPIYVGYIARKNLEKELTRILLEKDRYPIVTLKGGGGIGKTSLALAVLQEISKTDRYQTIFWFSSRDIDLKLEGPKPVKNTVLNQTDVAIEFTDLLEKSSLKKKEEKLDYLSSQMKESEFGPSLFVFDNFETVSNPTEFFVWLDTFIRNPNKILITSRSSTTFKADYPIEITGMEESECRELIEETSKSFGINQLLNTQISDKIIQESNGHPYIIKIFLGELAKDPKNLNIKRVVANKDEILVALFRRTYDWLSPSAKRVFLTLCSWNSIIPQIALEAVLLREENERIEVDEAVEELRKSSFVEIIASSTNEVETFLSVPLAASLFGKKELEVSPYKIAILNDRELLEEFGASQTSDIGNGIKPKILRKFKVVAEQLSQGKVILESHLPTLEYISRKYPDGWIYLSKIYDENGNTEKAQDALREFLKTDSTNQEKKEVWQMLADSYEKSDDSFGRIGALNEKISLGDTSLFELSELANEINLSFRRDNLSIDSDVKRNIVSNVATHMENNIEHASATDYSRLAWLYMALKNKSEALRLASQGLKKEPNNQYCIKLANQLNT